jgi:hypothetical protein
MENPVETLKDRFLSHVAKKNNKDCWLWIGNKNKLGYGKIWNLGKHVPTHRMSWMIYKGKIPKGLFICHHCDNPSCVNPEHLFLGTAKDNHDDCISKNRIAFGKRNKSSKLTYDKAVEIRNLYKACKSMRKLGSVYNVSGNVIWHIIHNKTWTIPE